MPRRVRIESVGFHHIFNRGVAKNQIFNDNSDKEKFMEIVCEICTLYKFNIHSYCLMDNHYHLLLENTLENLSAGMRQINSKYAIYFNKKYDRVGHLWQDRFKSWYILDEHYLLILFKYIELNPVKANLSNNIGEYQYSFSWELFNNKLRSCMQNSFVLTLYDTKELLKSLEIITNATIKEIIDEIHKSKIEIKNDTLVKLKNKTIKKHFEKIDKYDKIQRAKAIAKCYQDGYTQREIGDFLNLSNTTISKILKNKS